MIQDIAPKVFDNTFKERKPQDNDILLVFRGHDRSDDQVLARVDQNQLLLPMIKEVNLTSEADLIFLFSIDDVNYYLAEDGARISETELQDNASGWEFLPLRTLRLNEPQDICFAGMTAYHLFSWYRSHRFCGSCGKKLIHDDRMRMMKCPVCGGTYFPTIAPAVIVGLIRGDSILISRYANREYKGRALLAGFCEIGETPEETVAREVMEEVGLKVKNIQYFGSQPWGFDSNLLLGYFCELDGDSHITLDEEELATAGFVKREDIEPDSNLLSLTATMIEAFRTNQI